MSQFRYSLQHETPRSLTTQAENENESDELLSNLNEEKDNKFASLIIETLCNKVGWKTEDGKMTKNCRARLGMYSLARHFSSFCRPESSTRPVAKFSDEKRKLFEPLLRECFSYFKLRAALTFIKLFNTKKEKDRRKLAYSRRKVQCRKESNIAPLEPHLNKAKKRQK